MREEEIRANKFPAYLPSDAKCKELRVGDYVTLKDNSHCLLVEAIGFKQGYASPKFGNPSNFPCKLLAIDCVLPTTGICPQSPNDAIISVCGNIFFTKLRFLKRHEEL